MRRFLKILTASALVLFILGVILAIVFKLDTRLHPPEPADWSPTRLTVENPEPALYTCGKSWVRRNPSGLWELYLEGKPFERGVIEGKLTQGLIEKQEKAFTDRITEMIPSPSYLKFLKYFIYWFNRDIEEYIPQEYKEEIYGISLSASERFSFIGTGYQRLLNYHSAHDIGHALQDLQLVGCTSFGVWGSLSTEGSLLIGRNFDFYAGDPFAENKIVCFEKPEKGLPFMMVTWGGMTGAVSGMNDRGLTVTINAAKSDIPWSARTPISILAREILQYAGNISEACSIAKKRETFVSESILIGSAEDGKAFVIEKSPYRMALMEPAGNYIISTNHFRSPLFQSDPKNVKDMNENASLYRYCRVMEEITKESPVDVFDMAKILRDPSGLGGKPIGMGNEKAINQLIAHHSVIFEPEKRRVWVSNGPWQIGSYTCYDISKIFHNFAGSLRPADIDEPSRMIPADDFLVSPGYNQYNRFRELRNEIHDQIKSGDTKRIGREQIRELTGSNPEYYEVYSIAGDYFSSMNRYDSAVFFYRQALGKVIPRENERKKIIEKLVENTLQQKKKSR